MLEQLGFVVDLKLHGLQRPMQRVELRTEIRLGGGRVKVRGGWEGS